MGRRDRSRGVKRAQTVKEGGPRVNQSRLLHEPDAIINLESVYVGVLVNTPVKHLLESGIVAKISLLLSLSSYGEGTDVAEAAGNHQPRAP